jgi:hypothetical protein
VNVAEIPVGEIKFDLSIEQGVVDQTFVGLDDYCSTVKADPIGVPRKYEKAFLSYSRKDIAMASLVASALKMREIDLFVDLTEMEPGEEWRPRLKEAIDQADLFCLLWSNNAAGSEVVEWECRQVCDRWHRTNKSSPAIRPLALEEPTPKPPHCIADLHCDSRWRAMRLAGASPLFKSP